VGNRIEDGGSTRDVVKLTWVVREPSIPHDTYQDMLLRPVALEIRIGESLGSLELKPQLGSLFPFHQSVCKTTTFPLGPHEVARITFEEGGAGGYVVRRKPENTLDVLAWSQSDGACIDERTGDMIACAVTYETVKKLPIRRDATIEEALVEVDASGTRKSIVCAEAP
jgi:hypothetical protein